MTIDDADASGGTNAITYNGLSGYVRCVYDDWYWGASSKARLADTNLGTFTWGDIPRNAVTSSE